MTNIAFTMDDVAKIAVAPINADATTRASTGGNTLVFAGVVVSQKGKPFEVIEVTADNWMTKLGKPFHSSVGAYSDSMRSLDEALAGGNGVVVRVVPATATYPVASLTVVADAETGLETLTTTNEALNYASEFALPTGAALAFAIKDGAQSDDRKLTISQADASIYGDGMFVLTLSELSASGDFAVIEEKVVSFDPLAVDQMGVNAYVETVLESSQYLTCKVGAGAAQALALAVEPIEIGFIGASNGDMATITTADYAKAIDELKKTVKGFNYVCGLSIYDEAVIRELAEICKAKRISGYFDIDPRLSHAQALELKSNMGLNNHRASFVHVPYQAKCRFYGNMAVWGGSGVGFTAKAKGVAKSSPVGGWHYTPAGTERAVIPRSSLAPLANAGIHNPQEMYKARLNKLATDENGNLFIDDSLTSNAQENYLRFEQVVSIADAISRDFYALGNRIKHSPDGVTLDALTDGMKSILEGFEATGALVTPRDPADGESPWFFTVEQVEIDYWKVTWSFCPTGSARRIMGEPVLIR